VHTPVSQLGFSRTRRSTRTRMGPHGRQPTGPLQFRLGSVAPSQQVPVPAQHRVRTYQPPHPAKCLWAHAVQQRRHKHPVRPGEPHPSLVELAFQDSNLVAENPKSRSLCPDRSTEAGAGRRTGSSRSGRQVSAARPDMMPRWPPPSRPYPHQPQGTRRRSPGTATLSPARMTFPATAPSGTVQARRHCLPGNTPLTCTDLLFGKHTVSGSSQPHRRSMPGHSPIPGIGSTGTNDGAFQGWSN
jgi:hypothetical protein